MHEKKIRGMKRKTNTMIKRIEEHTKYSLLLSITMNIGICHYQFHKLLSIRVKRLEK